jgi:pyruvate dehydrogenase (quinone)
MGKRVADLAVETLQAAGVKNPDFGEVAKAMGLWGDSVSKAGELEKSLQAWLAQPGPALLHVR